MWQSLRISKKLKWQTGRFCGGTLVRLLKWSNKAFFFLPQNTKPPTSRVFSDKNSPRLFYLGNTSIQDRNPIQKRIPIGYYSDRSPKLQLFTVKCSDFQLIGIYYKIEDIVPTHHLLIPNLFYMYFSSVIYKRRYFNEFWQINSFWSHRLI